MEEKKYLYKRNIEFLNLARCISVFQIVLYHLVIEIAFPSPPFTGWIPWALWGFEGVGVFLAISGAGLINSSYYQFDAKQFYKKRFLTIYIPFWIAYIVVCIWNYYWSGFTLALNAPKQNFIFTVLGCDGLLLTMGIPTFYQIGEWYLGVLLLIYAIFPLWRKLFIRNPYLLTAFFLALRVMLCFNNPFGSFPVDFNPITALSNFTIGALAVYILKDKDKDKTVYRVAALIAGILLLIFGECIARMYNAYLGDIFAVVGLLLIYICIAPFVCRYLGKAIGFICKISYEVFLVHHMIIYRMVPAINAQYSKANFIFGCAVIVVTIFAAGKLLSDVSRAVLRLLNRRPAK